MHGQERRGSQHRLRIPLVALHLILNREFLEQPQYPLRPRVVEVMHRDHPGIVWHSSAANTAGEPLADQPFSPGGNHSALTERNSGSASQRSAITASPGYATEARLIASASAKNVYTQVTVMSAWVMRLPISHSPVPACDRRSSSASA